MHELIRRGLWIALALSAVLHPAAARADRVGLLPLRVQGGDPGEEVRLALRAAIGETLTAGGAEVHWPEAIEAAREAGRIPCADASCAPSITGHMNLSMLVEVLVRCGEDGTVRQMIVTFLSAEGEAVAGDDRACDVGPGDEAALVARQCTAGAREELDASRGVGSDGPVSVRIEGSPAGAALVLDGQPAGTLPREVELEPGAHELSVSRAGYRSRRVELEVRPGMGPVRVELEPESRTAEWAFPVGGSLLAAGVLVGVVPTVVGVASAGCLEQVAGECTRVSWLDVPAAVGWAVAGGVVAAVGVTLIVVGAVDGGTSEEEGGELSVRLGLGSVALEGSFR